MDRGRLLAVALLCASLPVRAQEAPNAARPPKSEAGALARSLWGTVIPVAAGMALVAAGNGGDTTNAVTTTGSLLFTAGVLAGPSLGYFYAERPGRAWTGIGVRVVGLALLVGAIGASLNCVLSESGSGTCDTAGTLALAGTVVTCGSAIYDIATVRGAVRSRNRERRFTVGVAPTYVPRRRAAGLAVGVGF